jgi:4-diphosphocytidyl-2-C-methyl-D-erythritol kinase
LATVFQAVDLYETVTATVREDAEIRLTVDAVGALADSVAGVPRDQSNLAWQAAIAVRERFGIEAGVDLHVLKGVPVAGGMAGGSADAAAAVVACAQAWDCGASRAELHELCAALGSDVPFALQGHTAVGLGRGDELSPAITRGEYHWVFAVRHDGLSTPAVFREFDRLAVVEGNPPADPALDPAIMRALSLGDPVALGASLRNDLQRAALSLAPDLEGTMDAMRDADALGVIVSGSGPTVAGLARNRQHALAIAAHVSALKRADATLCASGPVPGTVILEDV